MFILLSFATSALSQVANESIYGFREVIDIDDSRSKKTHSIITEWIGKNFSSDEDAIQFSNDEKIVVKYEFDLNPRIMRTFQNTTTKYVANGLLTFIIRDNKFRMDFEIEDSYSFDGKKSNPKSTFEILNGNVNDEFMKILITKGFMDVKQYGGFLSSLKTGDKKAKKAQKYVDKELKKGVYTQRLAKLSRDLNLEVNNLYNSLKEFINNYSNDDF